jgi:hypothetical protein
MDLGPAPGRPKSRASENRPITTALEPSGVFIRPKHKAPKMLAKLAGTKRGTILYDDETIPERNYAYRSAKID